MADFLFPNFLKDANEYTQTESLWREKWLDLVRRLGQEAIWRSPWLSTTYANGTPFGDGNPIFSALCEERRLGVSIIQLEPSDDVREISFWTDVFAKGDRDAVKQLVIICVLSEETLLDSLDLMKQWITDEEVGLVVERPDSSVTLGCRPGASMPVVFAAA